MLLGILFVDSTCTSKRIKGGKSPFANPFSRSLAMSNLKLPVQPRRTNPRFMSLAFILQILHVLMNALSKGEKICFQICSFLPSLCQTSMLLVDSNAELGTVADLRESKNGIAFSCTE